MSKKISKTEAKEKISGFFEDIQGKTPKEVKKIKKLAMKNKISLGENKKLFCSSCLIPFQGNEKIRIKKGFKTIVCKNCGKIKRIKL